MAVIGMLGGILFQVSDRQVLNFSKLQRSVSGKWSQYDVLGRKAVSVFLGPELQEVTLNVTLNAALGVKTPAAPGADGPYGGIGDSGCSSYRSQKDRTEPVGAYKEQRGLEPGICTWGTCPGGNITDS